MKGVDPRLWEPGEIAVHPDGDTVTLVRRATKSEIGSHGEPGWLLEGGPGRLDDRLAVAYGWEVR